MQRPGVGRVVKNAAGVLQGVGQVPLHAQAAGAVLILFVVRVRGEAVPLSALSTLVTRLRRWDIVNEAGNQTTGPSACLDISMNHNFGIDTSDFIDDVTKSDRRPKFPFLLQETLNAFVHKDSLGVAEGLHHQTSI